MSSLEISVGSQNSLYIVLLLTVQPDFPLNLLVSPKWNQLKKKEKERRQESRQARKKKKPNCTFSS